MSALAAARPFDDQPTPLEMSWGAMRLSGLLAATADRHTSRSALRDQPARDEWSQRPPVEWTYPLAYDAIERLSDFFVRMKLPPKSPIGICLPNGSEACLTLLAVEHAGMIPCLLPIAWPEDDLAASVEAAGVSAVVTQAVVGEERPAETFCRLASRYFGLRYIAAFGPGVPDGVTNLDEVVLNGSRRTDPIDAPEPTGENGVVTFWRQGQSIRPVFRSCQSVVAAAVTFLVTVKIRPGDRILTLLAPDDHCGVTTGLIASLLSGATLECHGLFSARAFVEAIADPRPTHLVVPAWMESVLAKAALPDSIASVILIHEAPTRFKAKTALPMPTIDVLAFGELALVAAPRTGSGQFTLSLDDEGSPGHVTIRHFLRARCSSDGSIEFAGLAADVQDFARGAAKPLTTHAEWRPSGFQAEMFAGILIGVRGEA